MKKTYCNPTLKVVKIQTENLLQFGSGTKDGSEAAARSVRFSDWDEDEE